MYEDGASANILSNFNERANVMELYITRDENGTAFNVTDNKNAAEGQAAVFASIETTAHVEVINLDAYARHAWSTLMEIIEDADGEVFQPFTKKGGTVTVGADPKILYSLPLPEWTREVKAFSFFRSTDGLITIRSLNALMNSYHCGWSSSGEGPTLYELAQTSVRNILCTPNLGRVSLGKLRETFATIAIMSNPYPKNAE